MTPPPELPLTFRQELAPHLFKAVAGGWSAAVVGLPGFGLSNLLRFVAEPRVAAHYLGDEAGQTLLVYLEADRLLDPPAYYGRIAHEVVTAARGQEWPRAEQAALRRLADAPASGALAEPLAGLIRLLCGDLERRVIFVCDEFDAALRGWPAAVLRELRALRDAHKYRLAVIAGLAREPGWLALERVAAERGAAERGGDATTATATAGVAKFAELFDQHTFPLRPYASADARLAIDRKTVGWPQPPTREQQDQLYRLTGGHAKLLIASLIDLEPRLHLPWPNIERGLLADPALAEICRAVWAALEPGEQWTLGRLARDERENLPETSLKRLELLGLATGGPAFIFSSLFEAYVLAQPEPAEPAGAPGPLSRLRDPEATVQW